MGEIRREEIPPPTEELWRSVGHGIVELSRNRLTADVRDGNNWFVDTNSPLSPFNVGGMWDYDTRFIDYITKNRDPYTDLTCFIGGIDPHSQDSNLVLAELRKRGVKLFEYSPHMLLKTDSLQSVQPPNSIYRPLQDPDELASALRIQSMVMDYDYEEIVRTMGIPPSSPQLDTYLLRANGMPVCTTQLVRDLDGRTASVWNMATLPQYQRKGYATQLLHSVLMQAKDAGISYVHLMASNEGEPLYRHLGFSNIRRYGIFEIPGTYGRK